MKRTKLVISCRYWGRNLIVKSLKIEVWVDTIRSYQIEENSIYISYLSYENFLENIDKDRFLRISDLRNAYDTFTIDPCADDPDGDYHVTREAFEKLKTFLENNIDIETVEI